MKAPDLLAVRAERYKAEIKAAVLGGENMDLSTCDERGGTWKGGTIA